jgi:hypothetical protein
MPFALYCKICELAVMDGAIFTWVFMILAWNCLGRSSSVDTLGLHNLCIGTDSIVLEYNDSKMDGTGQKMSPKNIYANPYKPEICPFTSLGVWLMLNPDNFTQTENIFLKHNNTPGSAGQLYGRNLDKVTSTL